MYKRKTEAKEVEPTVAQINSIVEGARWAPSGDNNQSFTFEWDGETLIIREDEERSRAFINVGNSASQMALGMCLTNIELVAAKEGWATRWTAETQKPVVAQVQFELIKPSSINPWNPRLADAIQNRAVDRRPYHLNKIPPQFFEAIKEMTKNPWGIQFHLIDQSISISNLARINSRFESFLIGHKSLHSYLFRWMRWSTNGEKKPYDGMPLSTMGLSLFFRVCFRLIANWPIARLVKAFGFEWIVEYRARRVYSRSAAFGAFTIPNTLPITFIRVGELWQRVWLMLTSEGWALQPVMGHSLMAHRCVRYNGEGLSQSERCQFGKENQEIKSVINITHERSIACLFRLGRPISPLGSRTLRRPRSDLLSMTAGKFDVGLPSPSLPRTLLRENN